VVRLHAHHFIADKDGLDEAKAAAQADYEARIRSALLEQPATPSYAAGFEACREAAGYAERLALALWEKHYRHSTPNWKPLSNDLVGLLTQIDNMTAALSALPAPAGAAGEVTVEELASVLSPDAFVVVHPKHELTIERQETAKRKARALLSRFHITAKAEEGK
jgi:hypothetical protein